MPVRGQEITLSLMVFTRADPDQAHTFTYGTGAFLSLAWHRAGSIPWSALDSFTWKHCEFVTVGSRIAKACFFPHSREHIHPHIHICQHHMSICNLLTLLGLKCVFLEMCMDAKRHYE